MYVCEVEDGTYVYGGLNGRDEGGWICMRHVLGEVLFGMWVVVVWGGDCGLVKRLVCEV